MTARYKATEINPFFNPLYTCLSKKMKIPVDL